MIQKIRHVNKKEKKEIGGFSANTLVIPLSVILAVLIVTIAILTLSVSSTTSDLANLMQRSSDYQQTATNLQAGSSVLSESMSGFVQMPVIQNGPGSYALNAGPLSAYVKELETNRRASDIKAYFKENGASEKVQMYIDAAADCSEQMLEAQLHAFTLIVSVYPIPENSNLKNIPQDDLTEEELAMSDEARLAEAKTLLIGKEYSQLKFYLNSNVENCHKTLQEEFDAASAKCKRDIFILRATLWAMIGLITAVMVLTFMLFYRWIVLPLKQYSKDITSDRVLKKKGNVKELRSMVTAYNGLWNQHNKLESMLRTAAETDALTDLPNRYRLERNIHSLDKEAGPLAVMLFDVNYLKQVNDTKGHLQGDKLLRDVARIINECFVKEDDSANCYRIGGDEFAVVMQNCTEEEVKDRIDTFTQKLTDNGISVSVGYAFDEKGDNNDFYHLMALADERMYKHKKEIHKLKGIDRSLIN